MTLLVSSSSASSTTLARINGHFAIINRETGDIENYIGDTHSVATTVVNDNDNDDFQEGI